MESTKEIKWANRSLWSRSIFIVGIVYFICAVVVLLLIFGVIPVEAAYFNPMAFIIFAMVSFFLSAFISAYHLSTRIRRRKRKSDQ